MLAIGVDIGGTKIATGVVDQDGNILEQIRVETNPKDPSSIDRAIAETCNTLMAKYDIKVIGVAAAGIINADRQTVSFAANIDWRNYPLAQNIKALLDKDVPVIVEKDSNAAGWAEYRFGKGRGTKNMLMLTVGTGLGGAIVANGQLLRGEWGAAGDVGHIKLVPNGLPCGCGHQGCWEQYASGSALTKAAHRAMIARPDLSHNLVAVAGGEQENMKGHHIAEAAAKGDQLALDIFAELGHWLGVGAASVSSLPDPEVIVVGGGVADNGDLVLNPARESFTNYSVALGHRPVAQIVSADFGNDAGIVGAADLARELVL